MPYTFFAGKGGVGKTTCSAAAAVRAASEGALVLVVSTDPAHSLGDALGIELGPEPRRVTALLHAAELDADRALTRWLRDREDAIRTIADRGTYLDEEDIDRLLALAFPGVDELVGLVELRRLADTRPWDHVIVDTAPTGHLLRLLEMPETLGRLGEVLDDMHAKHRFLASRLSGSWRPDFADQAIAEIEGEAKALRDLLRDPERASFTWVTLPEELSVRESEDGIAALEALGAEVGVVVVNRVEPAPDRPCPRCSPRFADQARWRKRIATLFGHTLLVPAQIEEPRGPEALLELALQVVRAPKTAVVAAASEPMATGEGIALPLPKTARLVLVGGKGGVGKTTVAAAMAIAIAKERSAERVLAISTDPAHSLGDALGMVLSDRPRDVTKNLEARELDAKAAWEKERARYKKSVEELFASLFRGPMDASFDRAVLEDLLDLSPPGIDELIALVTLLDTLLAKKPRYGVVVVDTAPTGHTLRLLELPGAALEWVHALMSVILKYRSVIGLGELASDLTDLARRLRALSALLVDPATCAFVAVTRPAALPREETERLAKSLRRLGVPLAAVVANAVSEPDCAHCTAIAAHEAPEIDRLDRLAARAARTSRLITAPAVFPPPRGVLRLRTWLRTWSYAARGS